MRLVQLIYASSATQLLELDTVHRILETSVANNGKRGITGFLCFNQHYFLQLIEGEASEVNSLYLQIAKDPRHCDLRILGYREIARRDYPQWSMGDCDLSNLEAPPLFRHCASSTFLPLDMSGESARELLKSLQELKIARGLTHGI